MGTKPVDKETDHQDAVVKLTEEIRALREQLLAEIESLEHRVSKIEAK